MGKTWKDNKHSKFDNHGRDNKKNKQKTKFYDCNNCDKNCVSCPKSRNYDPRF